jgi:hypothetical protein
MKKFIAFGLLPDEKAHNQTSVWIDGSIQV